ncbi:MAG: DUF3237 domain-containing protein [Gemmatimonadota bacterium]
MVQVVSRRSFAKLGGSLAALSLVGPSRLAFGNPVVGNPMTGGSATRGEPSFELLAVLDIELDGSLAIGPVPLGTRQIFPIKGGTFEGPNMRGEILPGGGDWLLRRSDGASSLDVRATLRTDDGALIFSHYRGILYMPPEAIAKRQAGNQLTADDYYFRIAPFFETSADSYGYLNRTMAVGIGELGQGRVKYTVYSIL